MRIKYLPWTLTIFSCLSGSIEAQVVDLRTAVNKVSPSIVAVHSKNEGQSRSVRRWRTEDLSKDPNSPNMFWSHSWSTVRDAISTGIVVGDKRVFTLAHGTPDMTYQIGLSDGSRLDAKVVVYDEVTDGVLLETSKDVGPPIELSGNTVELGQPLAAIWAKIDGEPMVGQGIVSSRTNWEPSLNHPAFEGNFSISMGASGGAVCDQHGLLVGVIEAFRQASDRASTWVVPVDQLTRLLKEVGRGSKVADDGWVTLRRGAMGVMLKEQTNQAHGIVDDSPADEAGIEVGDRILSVNGKPTRNASELLGEISKFRAGDTISLVYKRGDSERNLELVLTGNERASKKDGMRLEPGRGGSGGYSADDWQKFSEELQQWYQHPKGFKWNLDPNSFPGFVPAPPLAPRLQIERTDLEESIRELRKEIEELRQQLKEKK